MDPRRLLVLRAVRRAGGVQPAARALHLTPSGVSQHLSRLEAEAGVALVDRSRRGGGRSLTLTAAGRSLADRAEQVATALADAERELDRYKERRGGTVRVGGFATVLNQIVAPVVRSLAIAEPAIDPRIFEIEEDEGVEALVSGDIDLMLSDRVDASGPPRPGGTREVDLMTDRFRVVVPESWPDPDDGDTLLAGPWVLPAGSHGARRVHERIAGRRGVRLDVRHEGHHSGTMLALVASGLGAAVIPQITLSHDPRPGVVVHRGDLDPGSRVLTVLRPTADVPWAVERFLEELQREARRVEAGMAERD